jgi:hypothetical protein
VARKASDGSALATTAVDSPVFSSPAIANGRIFAASSNGTLYAFRGQNRPPSPPTVLAPADYVNVTDNPPTITWSGASDPNGDPLGYVLRYDTDGEVLDSWMTEVELPIGTTECTLAEVLPDDTHVSYAIRSRDARRALSPWTSVQHFWVNRPLVPPAPPTAFQALCVGASMNLSWTASASLDTAGYELAYAPLGQPLPAYFSVGNVLSWQVNGLMNGTTYLFSLRAYDYDDLHSEPTAILATPHYPVSLNGQWVDTLEEAVLLSSPGDLVELGPGTFSLAAPLELNGIVLCGYAPFYTRLDASDIDTALRLVNGNQESPSTVSMLTIFADGDGTGIVFESGEGLARNVIIHDMSIGLEVNSGASAAAVNMTISRTTAAAMLARTGSTLHTRNNIIIRNSGYGIGAEPGAAVNTLYDNKYDFGADDLSDNIDEVPQNPNGGDISADVVFVNEADGYFREEETNPPQPSVDAGDPNDDFDKEPYYNGGRVNMGAFGNTEFAACSPLPAASGGGGGGGICLVSSSYAESPSAAALWAWFFALYAVSVSAALVVWFRRRLNF